MPTLVTRNINLLPMVNVRSTRGSDSNITPSNYQFKNVRMYILAKGMEVGVTSMRNVVLSTKRCLRTMPFLMLVDEMRLRAMLRARMQSQASLRWQTRRNLAHGAWSIPSMIHMVLDLLYLHIDLQHLNNNLQLAIINDGIFISKRKGKGSILLIECRLVGYFS